MKVRQEVGWLKKQLKRHADSERARQEKRYLKSSMKFYGVNMPTERKIVKQWLRDHPDATIEEVARLAENLWRSQWHEEKTVAVMMLQLNNKKLTLKQIPLVQKMINEVEGWAHLDTISIHLVGALIDHDKKTLKYLPRWARSKNFWVRRAALLSQILQFRRGEGNKQLFFRLATPMFNI
jgi:3-methyladenine DNA glycosylase AlkD